MDCQKHEHHDEEYIDREQIIQCNFAVPHRGPCSVTFTVEPGDDTTHSGQGLIGLYKDPNDVKGYPVVKGMVASPGWQYYAAIYGWIQITNTPEEPWVMDVYPLFQDINNPFFFWGPEPILVDAPGRVDVESYDWTARTFLTYSPDACMTKTVIPIMGFEWGFSIRDFNPYVKPLKQLDVSIWNNHLELFISKYAGWTFKRAGQQALPYSHKD